MGQDNTGEGEETGRLLGGRYRLGGVLGSGGMGTVWRARDEILGRTVAVKELRFPSSVEEEEKRRLITRTLREAKAIARIRSGGVVTVFDVVDEDDRPWIVMELIEGRSLADQVRQDGPLSPSRAAEVGLAVLDVLRAAHREGIVHRDVKPSNVLIEDDTDRVVLTDFGIAKVEGDPSVTSTGMLVGAPSYISPERARGNPPGPPADMWSLGGLLYAAVEGHPPYDKGSALATLTAVMTEPLETPRQAGELAEVIHGLLAKDPEKRLDEASARPLLRAVASGPPPSLVKERRASRTAVLGTPAAGPAAATRAPASEPGAPEPATAPASGGVGALAQLPRRVWYAAGAVLVALVVLGVALAVNASGDDSKDGKGTDDGRGNTAAEPSRSSEKAGKPEGADKDDKDPESERSKLPKASKSPKSKLPKGYRATGDDQFHFGMAMPSDFRRTGIAGQNSGGKYSAGGYPRIQVDFNAKPGSDAAGAWRQLESAVRSGSSGYHRVGIKSVKWRDYPTVADWTFERQEGGRKVRVLNRGFKADSTHGYAIMITCDADKWDKKECRVLRETAFRTFQPKG
ncbi:protein kinase [Streptomyces sp. NPDC005438]|uniref:protein kinase domain-containing protein n=1 Tax=Streptomyces sp. NPDC005438 TaxID=3156880 RepID=UPI0033B97948